MPGRLSSFPPPQAHVPDADAHARVHTYARAHLHSFPHEASQDPHDSMQSFHQDQANQRKINPHRKPSPVRPAHSILHCKKPPAFGQHPSSPFANALVPASCLSPSRQVLKGSQVSGRREDFCFQTTRVVLRCPTPPGREGYKGRSGGGRGRGCHHGRGEKASWIPLQKTPIVHRRLSWFVIVHRTIGKETRENKKKRRKEKRRYKGNGWYISVGCPKL